MSGVLESMGETFLGKLAFLGTPSLSWNYLGEFLRPLEVLHKEESASTILPLHASYLF